MAKQTYPKSFRLNRTADLRLKAYCYLTNLDSSAVARASIAQFIQGVLMGRPDEEITKLADLFDKQSTEKPIKQDAPKKEHVPWAIKFWDNIKKIGFKEKVIKAVGDGWGDLKNLDPEELAEKYNNYCDAEQLEGKTFCHPNSWLANKGYENNEVKEQKGNFPDWDIE